jgi:subtilase family serine protease
MKRRKFSFISAALLFVLPLTAVSVFGQAQADPQEAAQATTKTPPPTEPTDAEPTPVEPFTDVVVTPKGTIITPLSSVSRPGKGVHTNFKIFVPAGQQGISSVTPTGETPASMACVYDVGPVYTGCNKSTGGTGHVVGGWGAIALVDAYDDPKALHDISYFSTYFGLPPVNFTTVYANTSFGTLNGLTASCAGTPPPANSNYGWDIEESLDIEWAHAMAPSAKIILVEACSQSLPDLLFAEEVAGIKVLADGGGEISNSWGYPEGYVGVPGDGGGTLTEQQDDNFLFRYYWKNITYFASAGDSGSEVLYPSASPWVVSAGGTTVNRNGSGNFVSESCWADSGGGFSTVETWASPPSISAGLGPWTDYQYEIYGQDFRSTPDISFNADPNSGVSVYDTDEGGTWYTVGGTSVSSPALAGLVNSANNRLGQAPTGGGYYHTAENNMIYPQLETKTAYAVNWYDVKSGSNGHAAVAGYDQCTGIGSPRGFLGK